MSQIQRFRRGKIALLVAAVLVLLTLSAGVALGAAVYRYTNGGAVSAVRAAVTTGIDWQTESHTFVAITGMSVNVNVPNGQNAILVITLSAEEACVNSGYCVVAPYVDGVQNLPAIMFDHAPGSGWYEARSFQWVTRALGPGSHTITMAGRTGDSATFSLYTRTLTVMRSKA